MNTLLEYPFWNTLSEYSFAGCRTRINKSSHPQTIYAFFLRRDPIFVFSTLLFVTSMITMRITA